MTWILQTAFLVLMLIAIMIGTEDIISRHWEYRAVHIEGCTPYFDGS